MCGIRPFDVEVSGVGDGNGCPFLVFLTFGMPFTIRPQDSHASRSLGPPESMDTVIVLIFIDF